MKNKPAETKIPIKAAIIALPEPGSIYANEKLGKNIKIIKICNLIRLIIQNGL